MCTHAPYYIPHGLTCRRFYHVDLPFIMTGPGDIHQKPWALAKSLKSLPLSSPILDGRSVIMAFAYSHLSCVQCKLTPSAPECATEPAQAPAFWLGAVPLCYASWMPRYVSLLQTTLMHLVHSCFVSPVGLRSSTWLHKPATTRLVASLMLDTHGKPGL